MSIRQTKSYHELKVTSSGARDRKMELSNQEESALVGYLTYMAIIGIPCSKAINLTKVLEVLDISDIDCWIC